jgi:hypothetical protein
MSCRTGTLVPDRRYCVRRKLRVAFPLVGRGILLLTNEKATRSDYGTKCPLPATRAPVRQDTIFYGKRVDSVGCL